MLICRAEHLFVIETGSHLCNVENVVSIVTEPCDDLLANAFVDQYVHQPVGFKGYTTSAFSDLDAKARAAFIPSRVRRGWASSSCSMVSPAASLSRISSTGNSCSRDYRLAHHNAWVRSNQLFCHVYLRPIVAEAETSRTWQRDEAHLRKNCGARSVYRVRSRELGNVRVIMGDQDRVAKEARCRKLRRLAAG